METVFRLKVSELNTGLIKALQSIFQNTGEVEIIVHPVAKSLNKQVETRDEYWARINRAIDDVENDRNVVSFTGDEFEALVKKLKSA